MHIDHVCSNFRKISARRISEVIIRPGSWSLMCKSHPTIWQMYPKGGLGDDNWGVLRTREYFCMLGMDTPYQSFVYPPQQINRFVKSSSILLLLIVFVHWDSYAFIHRVITLPSSNPYPSPESYHFSTRMNAHCSRTAVIFQSYQQPPPVPGPGSAPMFLCLTR